MGCGGPKYQPLTPTEYQHSLARTLVGTADDLRDLYTRFGLRPYRVRIIRTRWTGGSRGVGEEYLTWSLEIAPTPLVSDLTSLQEVLQPVGLDEVGSLQLSEVSGRFSDENLRGLDVDGTPPADDEQVFYEIEFPRADGKPGEKRRFFLRSAPHYRADSFEWVVTLERAQENRDRRGGLR